MKKKWHWLIGFLCIGLLIGVAQATAGQEDPLISLSYLEVRVAELKQELKAWVLQNPYDPNNPVVNITPSWQVITLEKGERLISQAGCELILRGGKASALASVSGGLSDLTGGFDLATGDQVLLNHQLLVPRSDGRGLLILEFAYVMVKGEFIIQPAP